MTKNEILEILEEVTKIYFDYNCTLPEAIERAKEVMEDERISKMEKANQRNITKRIYLD